MVLPAPHGASAAAHHNSDATSAATPAPTAAKEPGSERLEEAPLVEPLEDELLLLDCDALPEAEVVFE